MHIEINGETEKLIQSGLSSGEFATVEEAVAVMAQVWANAKANKLDVLPRLPAVTDIRALAAAQGVRPFDSSERVPNIWPADESADEFLEFIRDVRNDDLATDERE